MACADFNFPLTLNTVVVGNGDGTSTVTATLDDSTPTTLVTWEATVAAEPVAETDLAGLLLPYLSDNAGGECDWTGSSVTLGVPAEMSPGDGAGQGVWGWGEPP